MSVFENKVLLITGGTGSFGNAVLRRFLDSDLNYDKYFTEGNEDVSKIEDYHSHNTRRLDVEGMKELLLKLRFIREDLGLEPRAKSKDIRSE